MIALRDRGRGQGAGVRSLGVWIALAAVILFGALRYEGFLGAYNVASFLSYNSMFVLVAVGMAFVIMTGGIDLSVGSVAALASVAAAHASPWGIEWAMPAGVAVGLAAGAVNAACVAGLRVAPFIATLATMLAARGAALVWADNASVPIDWAGNFTRYGLGRAFGVVPWPILAAAAVVLAAWLALERTPFGRHVLAVGGSEEASGLMGLPVRRTLWGAYLLSGACAGLAGVTLASGYGAGQPLEGQGWELSAIASVVVGGTLLTGGVGSVPATVAGALLLGLVFNILNFENGRGVVSLSAYWQSVIRGAFLLLVIVLQAGTSRQKDAAAKQGA